MTIQNMYRDAKLAENLPKLATKPAELAGKLAVKMCDLNRRFAIDKSENVLYIWFDLSYYYIKLDLSDVTYPLWMKLV